jgi:exodeoxyribonuclease VIII
MQNKITTKRESNYQYHAADGISSSGLKKIYSRSVWHYLNQSPFSSAAMQLGSAIHTAILEPKQFYDEYVVMQKFDGRTTEGKKLKAEYEANAEGKATLTADEFAIVEGVLHNYNRNEKALYYTRGEIELSHYLNFNGVDVKVRPDCINKVAGFISDPKTCQDNSPKSFIRDVYKYNYHLQAAFYSDMLGIDPSNFVFIAIETRAPYSVECYVLADEHIERGRAAYLKALADWQFYLDTGVALGYDGYNRNDEGLIIL